MHVSEYKALHDNLVKTKTKTKTKNLHEIRAVEKVETKTRNETKREYLESLCLERSSGNFIILV